MRLKITFLIAMLLSVHLFGQQQEPSLLNNLLTHYKKEPLKQKAAKFLLENVSIQKSKNYRWKDSLNNNVTFNELNYADLDQALDAFVELKDSLKIHPEKYTVKDNEVLTSEFLIKNIDLAFAQWKNNPWAKEYDFNTFCEYILPYRSLVEPLEDWREEYQFLTQQSIRNLDNDSDPIEVATQVILGLKDYRFLASRPDPIPLLSPKQLLFRRQGACSDLANLSLLACRSIGLAATFDFTPHYAASSARHYWNAIIDNTGVSIPFNGNSYGNTDGLPYAYHPEQEKRLAKVYRKTYSIQKESLKTQYQGKIPFSFLQDANLKDVTEAYVETAELTVQNEWNTLVEIAYLNVFNTGRWRGVSWAKKAQNNYTFQKMGREIVYLPSVYIENKMKYAQYPLLLNGTGQTTTLKPREEKRFDFVFDKSNTLRENKYFREHNSVDIQDGELYVLLVWDGKWKKVSKGIGASKKVEFKNVPENALYYIVSKNSNRYERIFTIDSKTKKINWY